MNNIVPLINGKSYEWSDITLNIMNQPIVGITKISYSEKQNQTNVYGAGRFPVSRGYGSIEPEASITLLMEEVQNIMSVAPNGRLMDIPEFDITVAYLDDALTPVLHKIRNVRFKNNTVDVSQGDTSIGIELELICSNIDWK